LLDFVDGRENQVKLRFLLERGAQGAGQLQKRVLPFLLRACALAANRAQLPFQLASTSEHPIGVNESARAVARFQAQFPNVDVTVVQAQMRSTLEGVKNGEIDCTFHSVPANLEATLTHRVLLRGARPVIVTRNDNPLAAKRRVSLRELAAQPWMLPRHPDFFRTRIENIFTRAGIAPPKPVLEYSAIVGSARFLIERRDLVSAYYDSFIDAVIVSEQVARVHAPEISWSASSSVIYRRDTPLSPAAAKLVEIVRAVCNERVRR